ncbi:MFS transporter [Agromyces endophyticus]|uniref:MFS transporter n=1 Tax=Agromyces sp. H17E-10 TaxID=2932244 RepID=UPI001FD53EB6|nr:MFS transporter [Agromyces sp. H17E-10]UOQ90046.1 MFS transporter [Agromyces sp. H17E-10]
MTHSVWRAPGMPALLTMVAAGFSGYAVLLPVAPQWAVTGGADAAGAGLVTGVFMLSTVLFQVFVPAALRRLGWGPVLVAGLVLLGAPSLALLASNDLVAVLAVSAVRGAGFAVLTVAGSGAVADLVEPARRGRAIGAFGLAIAGPQLLLLPLAPWVAQTFGYGWVFVAGALPLVGIVPAVRLARRLHARHAEQAAAAASASKHVHQVGRGAALRALFAPVGILLGVTLAGGALITFTPQVTDNAVAVTFGLALFTGMAALTRWLVGGLADRYGTHQLLWPFIVATTAGLGLVAWAVVGLGEVAGSSPAVGPGGALDAATAPLLVGLAFVGVSYGALQNLTMGEAFAVVQPNQSVFASAVWNIGFDAGSGIGAIVVGVIATGSSFSVAFLVAGAISLATLPLALRRRPTVATD